MQKFPFILYLLFFAINANSEWIQLSGPTANKVNSVFTYRDVLFVGTYEEGLFKSTDFGETWTNINPKTKNNNILFIKEIGDEIFIGERGESGGGIYRTTDFGTNWELIGLNYYYVYDIIKVNEFYIAATSNGIFRSKDDFSLWEKCQTGFTFGTECLAADGNIIFAGTYGGGVYRSTDLGDTWEKFNEGFEEQNIYIYCLMSLSGKLFAGTRVGLYYSPIIGGAWKKLKMDYSNPMVSSLYSNNNVIFAGTTFGLYVSTDFGETWNLFNKGLIDPAVFGITLLRDYVYIATQNGVWKHSIYEIISSVNEDANEANLIEIHPNPFEDVIKLKIFNSDINFELADLIIYDLFGRKLEGISITNQGKLVEINMSNLSQGCYFIYYCGNRKEHQVIKIIVKK